MSSISANAGNRDSSWAEIFSIGCVWFGTHVGGGFATGNQVYQFYVSYGWLGAFMPILAMFIQAWCLRQALIMARANNLVSYKDFFSHLWQPHPRLSITFEIFYWIILLAAVSIAIAGAASLLSEDVGMPYGLAVLITGALLFVLTIFGSDLVARASTAMCIVILVACACIYVIGISMRWDQLADVFTVNRQLPRGALSPFMSAVVYAGFQLVNLPAIIACSTRITTMRSINRFFWLGFLMNALALIFAALLLFAWSADIDLAKLTLPNVTICNLTGHAWLYWCYATALFLAFISTGVTCIFGLVVRLENSFGLHSSGILHNITVRRGMISLFIMVISMGLSLIGLTPLIRYGYGFCGYLSIIVVILPLVIIAQIKNKKFIAEHPTYFNSQQ